MINRIAAAVLSATIIILLCVINPRADFRDASDVKSVLRDGFYSFSESIDISKFEIQPSMLSEVLSDVLKDDPYLFFVDGNMSYSFVPGGSVIAVKPRYFISGEDAFEAWEFCRSRAKELAKEAQRYSTDIERALYLHDRICLAYEYDVTLESDTMYSFFKNGRGTCQSYTHAYMAVLRECGIESHYVASDSIEHMWNYVKLDGEWYHVDLTWDDSGSGVSGVSRRHFLSSDQTAEKRGHRDWYSSINVDCSSEKYSGADFDSLASAFHLHGDVDHNGIVALSDVLYLRGKISGVCMCNVCPLCADLDENGIIEETDVALVRKKLLFAD